MLPDSHKNSKTRALLISSYRSILHKSTHSASPESSLLYTARMGRFMHNYLKEKKNKSAGMYTPTPGLDPEFMPRASSADFVCQSHSKYDDHRTYDDVAYKPNHVHVWLLCVRIYLKCTRVFERHSVSSPLKTQFRSSWSVATSRSRRRAGVGGAEQVAEEIVSFVAKTRKVDLGDIVATVFSEGPRK